METPFFTFGLVVGTTITTAILLSIIATLLPVCLLYILVHVVKPKEISDVISFFIVAILSIISFIVFSIGIICGKML